VQPRVLSFHVTRVIFITRIKRSHAGTVPHGNSSGLTLINANTSLDGRVLHRALGLNFDLCRVAHSHDMSRKKIRLFCKNSTIKRKRARKFPGSDCPSHCLLCWVCYCSIWFTRHRRHLDPPNEVQDMLIEKTVSIPTHELLRFCIVSIRNVPGDSSSFKGKQWAQPNSVDRSSIVVRF
jgi:hypothetical protein